MARSPRALDPEVGLKRVRRDAVLLSEPPDELEPAEAGDPGQLGQRDALVPALVQVTTRSADWRVLGTLSLVRRRAGTQMGSERGDCAQHRLVDRQIARGARPQARRGHARARPAAPGRGTPPSAPREARRRPARPSRAAAAARCTAPCTPTPRGPRPCRCGRPRARARTTHPRRRAAGWCRTRTARRRAAPPPPSRSGANGAGRRAGRIGRASASIPSSPRAEISGVLNLRAAKVRVLARPGEGGLGCERGL